VQREELERRESGNRSNLARLAESKLREVEHVVEMSGQYLEWAGIEIRRTTRINT